MTSTTETPAQAAAHTFERTVSDLKTGVDTATAAYGNLSERAAKTTSDLTSFSKGTFEAFTEANQILASEAQDLFRQMTASSQAAFAESLSGFRALVGAKSLKEGLELQATLARTAAIWAVSESSRFARAGIDLAEKASAPLAARAYLAAEKMSAAQR